MPRSIKLSWQPGSRGKPGYWKKFYKGKVHYFPSGSGKSDMEAYDAAWLMWERKKAEIDATLPRKHQQDYEQCILGWEKVLAWSSKYADKEHADQAERKLVDLRRRFAAVNLTPLSRSDWFESLFDSPDYSEVYAAMGLTEPDTEPSRLPPGDLSPVAKYLNWIDGSPRRISKEIWSDRLATQERKAAPKDESLGTHVKLFLAEKETQVSTGELSVGRAYSLRLHLERFRDWHGADTNVSEIDGSMLLRYKAHLSEKVASSDWSRATASHCLDNAKSFVRWLYELGVIAELPRAMVIKSNSLTISVPEPDKVTFSMDEIKKLLKDAKDRVKLYVLLSLNCSFTEKDIGDLLASEVRWNEGRIIRKRSKTKDEKNVPVVDYKLWPETLRLLKQEAAEGSERVLLNNRGGPLWSEGHNEGKYKKCDSIRLAFRRLQAKTKITKPFKSLKKTSASMLKNNAQYSGLTWLFLGHAPRNVDDRNYTTRPQELLDQAVTWLGQEFGLIERPAPTTPDSAKPDNSEAQPSNPVSAPESDAAEPAVNRKGKARSSHAGRHNKAARKRPVATAKDTADSSG